MARHRNIRKMRYEDELSNDEYGLSYDDLKYYAVSPDTEEMFTYNREATKEHTLSSFIEEPSINEQEQFPSDEENDNDQNADFKMPELDDADQAKLQLGLESLEGILGENCHQPTAVDALMKFNYDIEKALDDILSKGGRQTLSLETKSSSKSKDSQKISFHDFSSDSNVSPGVPCMSLGNKKVTTGNCSGVRPSLHNDTWPDSGSIVPQQYGHSNNTLINKSLSSLASVEETKLNGISDLVHSPLVSKMKKNSFDEHTIDKLVEKPLSLVLSVEVPKSDGLSGFIKPLHTSKMTTTSLGQHKRDKKMEPSLASMKETTAHGPSGLLEPSLTSRLTTTSLLKQILSSLESIEEAKTNGNSGFMKPSHTSKSVANSSTQSESENLMKQLLSFSESIEETKTNGHSGIMKPSHTSKLAANSSTQSKRYNVLKQLLSYFEAAEEGKTNGHSDFRKPSHTSKLATNSWTQSEWDKLLEQFLNCLSAAEVTKPNGLSGCIKPSLTSKVTENMLGKSVRDTLMKQSLSSLVSMEQTKSDSVKPSLISKLTTNSLGRSERDNLMGQSLSSLASMDTTESAGLSGFMKPSLISKMTTNSSGQSLSSLTSTEKTKPNGLSGFMKPSLISKVKTNSSGQSLSSLTSTEETKPNGLSGIMKPSLTSILTTNSSGQSLTSLASIKDTKADSLSGVLESPHTSVETTTSSHVSKSDIFVKPSLTSLMAIKGGQQSQSDRVLDSPNHSLAEHRANTDLFSSPHHSIALSPGLDKSLELEIGARSKNVHTLKSNSLFSGDTFPTPLTPLKNSASTDLAMKSSEKFSSKMETASLSDLAKNDKPDSLTHVNAFAKLASKVGQKGVLSGVTWPEIDSMDSETGETGTSVSEMNPAQNSPLMEGPEKGRTCERKSPTSVKTVSTSLRKLSLESALKRSPNKANGAIGLHSINKRLHENGRVPKPFMKTPESHLINHNTAFNIGLISNPASTMTDCEDTFMDNDSDVALKSIPMVTKRVRKRQASLFGQALSALHGPKVKHPRRDPLYDNSNGFELPVTVDLRGMLGSNHKLNVFNFSVPSRDDEVRSKQSQAFSKTKRRQVLPNTCTFKTMLHS